MAAGMSLAPAAESDSDEPGPEDGEPVGDLDSLFVQLGEDWLG